MRTLLVFLVACRTLPADPASDQKRLPVGEDARPEEATPPTRQPEAAELSPDFDDLPGIRTVLQTYGVSGEATWGSSGLTGQARGWMDYDGVDICRIEVDLEGNPWAGDCLDCDFAFDIEATVRSRVDNPSCPITNTSVFIDEETGYLHDPVLAFWSTYTTPTFVWTYGEPGTPEYQYYSWGGYVYENMLRAGWTQVWPGWEGYYGYYPGGETFLWANRWIDSGYTGYGTVNRVSASEDTIEWESTSAWETYAPQSFATECELGGITEEDFRLRLGDQPGRGELSCVGSGSSSLLDGWTFEVEAGDWVSLSVDTVSAETTFDPFLWVISPDGCTYLKSDESFECSFAPDAFGCPGLAFLAPQGGTWTAVVGVGSSCEGETAGYRIDRYR